MVAWFPYINVILIFVCAFIGMKIYIRSVSPAALEKKYKNEAYSKCTKYRQYSSYFLSVPLLCYLSYLGNPLPIGLPLKYSSRLVTMIISLVLFLVAAYFFVQGRKTLGYESMITRKGNQLVEGSIYQKIRHPQSLGEMLFWLAYPLLLNSPFLTILSLMWVFIYTNMNLKEEKDLELRYGQPYIEYKQRTGFLFPKGVFSRQSVDKDNVN